MQAFYADLTASQTAHLLWLNRKTFNQNFGLFRAAIAPHQAAKKTLCIGLVEVGETYPCASRPRGMLGKLKRRCCTLKQPVLGVLERSCRVFTEIIPDPKKTTLPRLIRGHIALETTVASDGWRGNDGLDDVGYDGRLRFKKVLPQQLSDNGAYFSGIESLWSFIKRRLPQLNAVTKIRPSLEGLRVALGKRQRYPQLGTGQTNGLEHSLRLF